MSLRLAVSTEDFGTTLKKAIGLASQLEVHGVRLNTRSELDLENTSATGLRQIQLYVTERQMQVAGLSCPTKHSLYDDKYLEPRLETIRKSMSLVRKLNTSELLVRCGYIPDPEDKSAPGHTKPVHIDEQANPFSFAPPMASTESPPSQKFSTLCQILNELTQHGNHVGCVINLQLPSFDLRLIKRLRDEVKAGPMNFVFDPATAIMTGATVEETFRELYEHIGYVRARDAVVNVDGAGTEVRVGAGVVDWVQLIPTLVEANYTGWLCVERTGGDTRSDDVRRGVSELKTLIPQSCD